MLKHKIVALVISAHAHVGRPHVPTHTPVAYGPDGAGRYSVVGEGFVSTKACTVSAERGMRVRIEGRTITFLDLDGEEEGQCEIGARQTVVTEHPTIRRGIGTVEP